jgi:hypothetical protein
MNMDLKRIVNDILSQGTPNRKKKNNNQAKKSFQNPKTEALIPIN